jgi:fatty-acyl-CoA synthase
VGDAVEWTLPGIQDVLATAVPERDMVVCGSVRRTYGDVASRTRGLAAFLAQRGVGLHRERSELDRWERGQDTIALVLFNCAEYIEALLGGWRARAAPFNVNQHYRPGEIADLFAMTRPAAIVYHRALGPLLGEALALLSEPTGAGSAQGRPDGENGQGPLLIDVDDGSGVVLLDGSTNFESAVATPVDSASLPVPSPDDLYLVCTGGTTGTPKAVLWREADIVVSGMGGGPDSPESLAAAAAAGGSGTWFAAPPLMHAAAQWTAFGCLNGGGTIVLHDDSQPFDARTILATAEREGVRLMSIVGDAYARPMVDELRRGSYDLSALTTLATGGAATNEQHKVALLDLLPHLLIIDGYGASETGGMAFGARTKDGAQPGFAPSTGAAVLSADRSRFLEPGEDEIGWTARSGRVPLGYLDDRAKTEATFPVVDGQRVSVPGDRARLAADGSIEMLGRDALVVNTGGEKVFVEEVEAVLRRHPLIADALVVGRPSERYGQEIVALVQPRPGAVVTPAEVRECAAAELARFKAPRAVAILPEIARLPNGKPNYTWARTAATSALDATNGG